MDLVACTGSFLLGGVSAVMIMGLLLLFLQHPKKRVRDDQLLKEIADALLPRPEFEKPAEMLKVEGAETAETQKIRPEEGFATGHAVAARRLGMAYTPVSELH
jgi:hypothetical protein